MNHTENAIMQAFLELLEEKPFNKITVKNIVERCQINRNTFYYHFHDILDLLDCTLKKSADEVIRNYSKFGTPIHCIEPLIEYATSHKKAIFHIYHSVHREIFLNQLERLTHYVVTQYIDTVIEELPPSEDKNLMIWFYKCLFVGITLDWLDKNMNYDLAESVKRICELFEGTGKEAFLRCIELSEKPFSS